MTVRRQRAAARWRLTFPPFSSWFLQAARCESWSLGTIIQTHKHTHTHSRTHAPRLLLWCVLPSDTLLRGFSLLSFRGFETWVWTLPSQRQRTKRKKKKGGLDGRCRCGECSRQAGCLSAGRTAVLLDQPRTHQVPVPRPSSTAAPAPRPRCPEHGKDDSPRDRARSLPLRYVRSSVYSRH